MDYYSATNKGETATQAAAWMNPGDEMPSGRSQPQETTHCTGFPWLLLRSAMWKLALSQLWRPDVGRAGPPGGGEGGSARPTPSLWDLLICWRFVVFLGLYQLFPRILAGPSPHARLSKVTFI